VHSPDPTRRHAILEAAQRLLRLYGPAKTTMAEIAREAAIGVGSLYLEFASKDAIVEELSSGTHHAVLSEMRAAAAPGRADFAQRFRSVMNARFESMLRLAEAGTHAPDLFHCGRPAVQTAHARFEAAERELLASLFRDAVNAREFHIGDPDLAARTVLRAYASFAPPWVFSTPRDEARRLIDALHDLVLAGLVVRGDRSRSRRRP